MSFLREQAVRQFGDAGRWSDVMAAWQLKRLIKPSEVADVVVFLASDRAKAICGVTVNIDEGFGSRSYPSSRDS